jgi:hypothetical protein
MARGPSTKLLTLVAGTDGFSVASCKPGRSPQTRPVRYSLMGKASSVSSTTVWVQACDVLPTPFHHSAQQLAGADLASPEVEFGAILTVGWPGGSARGR